MSQIIINELPTELQNQINEAEKRGETVTIITQNGLPVAIITPIKQQQKETAFGKLKNRTEIVGDILEPSSNFIDWKL
jgi:antitoxin VapB